MVARIPAWCVCGCHPWGAGAVNSPFTKLILDNPEKLAYIKERIPLGRLAEPEDIVGGCRRPVAADHI
jgi:NAD(P)-dependent dehydrogenase (short-subunit alcohol dehydrogenase family)